MLLSRALPLPFSSCMLGNLPARLIGTNLFTNPTSQTKFRTRVHIVSRFGGRGTIGGNLTPSTFLCSYQREISEHGVG